MKTILTQNTLILFALVIIAAFSFTACNDMVSPNDAEINNGLFSEEYEGEAEARRRVIAAAEAAAEAEGCGVLEPDAQSLALQYVDFKNEDTVGNITYTLEGSILTITFNGFFGEGVNPGENWSFARTAVYVGSSLGPITSGGGSLRAINQFPYINTHNTHPTLTSTHVIDLNNHPDITVGGSFVMVTHGDAGILNSNGNMPTGGASRKSVYAGNLIGGQQGNLFKYLSSTFPEPCVNTGSFGGAQ